MRAHRRSVRNRARRLIVSALILAAAATAAEAGTADGDEWTRVQIQDSVTRAAVRASLDVADRWLTNARCETLFTEFQDRHSRPLSAALAALGVSGRGYLRLVLFRDGSDAHLCYRREALAFTTPGSRIVYVCGRDFARDWPALGPAALLHEALHSLGLDENPPSSRFITNRVRRLCAVS